MIKFLVYLSMVPVAFLLLISLAVVFGPRRHERSAKMNLQDKKGDAFLFAYLVGAVIWTQYAEARDERIAQARAASEQEYKELVNAQCGDLERKRDDALLTRENYKSMSSALQAQMEREIGVNADWAERQTDEAYNSVRECKRRQSVEMADIYQRHGLDATGENLVDVPSPAAKPSDSNQAVQAKQAQEIREPAPPPVVPPVDPVSAAYEIQRTPIEELVKDIGLKNFAIASGKASFEKSCTECHGVGGVGKQGTPNLTDNEWIWGGNLVDIEQSIRYGVRNQHEYSRQNSMPQFGAEHLLTPEQIDAVADYVLSLSHKAPATAASQITFTDNCVACHGDGGVGSTDMGAPQLNNDIWLHSGTKEGIVAQITTPQHGSCPTWVDQLDDPTIKMLAVYVHSLGGGKQESIAATPPSQSGKGAVARTLYETCTAYFDLSNKSISQGGCRGLIPDDWLQRGWTLDSMTSALNQCFASHGISPAETGECSMNDPRSSTYNTMHGK